MGVSTCKWTECTNVGYCVDTRDSVYFDEMSAQQRSLLSAEPKVLNAAWGNPKPTHPPKTPRPTVWKAPPTPRPTNPPKTPKPTAWKAPKTPKPTNPPKNKTPRPTYPRVKTPKPTNPPKNKTPKPTNPPKNKTPKPTNPPKNK